MILVKGPSYDRSATRTQMLCRAAELYATGRERVRPIKIAFVNSMSGAAFAAAERQYLRLLAAAAHGFDLEVWLYGLEEAPANADPQAARYFRLSDLWDSAPDALIVTGTEPRTADLAAESYWPNLKSLVDWARTNVASAIWSCLAGHAAVRCLDGVPRRPLPQKCFGRYSCGLEAKHPLLNGLRFPVRVQHSRWNELSPTELRIAGYQILTQSTTAGVDMFVKHEHSLLVFFQGHPEYERDTLLREYRRDVGRYLRQESHVYPQLPENCLDSSSASALLDFQNRAQAERQPALLTEMPPLELRGFGDPCGDSACRIYRNWLSLVSAMKVRQSACRLGIAGDFDRYMAR